MNTIIKQNGINFGLILGFLLALTTLLGYAVNSEILVSYWTLGYIFLTIIIIGIIAIAYAKKGLGGFISFKQAFTTYFISLIIGLAINGFVDFMVFNVIDTDFREVIKQKTIKKSEEQKDWAIGKMIDSGASESDIEEFETKFDKGLDNVKNGNQHSLTKQIQGFFGFAAFFSIFGLLLALILRRNNPSVE